MNPLLERWLELLAVASGILYVLLILRRNRLGWVLGAISSSIYVLLAARARLPMQSVLQGYYVVMAVYGWVSWTRNAALQDGRIFRWPMRHHLYALLFVVAASGVSAPLLAAETHAAWPLLDSCTTWISFVATWMVTRSVLENWFYWIGADAITVFLFMQQGYPSTAGLFLVYIGMAVWGFWAWLQRYRAQRALLAV